VQFSAEDGSILIQDLSRSQPLPASLHLWSLQSNATRLDLFTVHIVVQGHEENQAAAKDRPLAARLACGTWFPEHAHS
jgi:hypothetical protein